MSEKKDPAAETATWEESKLDTVSELVLLRAKLGEEEISILNEARRKLELAATRAELRIARRLMFGQNKYGVMNIAADKRDFTREAEEEILDWLVYIEMDAVRQSKP